MASLLIRHLDDRAKRQLRIRAASRPISGFDCQIAAIAKCHGAAVATRDTSGFDLCGIKVVNPWLTSA